MIPRNYNDWCTLIDEIETSFRNEEYIQIIRSGSISWTSGVAERFIQLVSNMIRKRVNAAQDAYQRQMRNGGGAEMAVSQALNALTKEYKYLYKISQALPIPSEHVKRMTEMIQLQADQTHNALMDSAKADRTGRLASIVRGAGVNKLSGGF